jgi:hypothetical protein
MLQTTPQDLVPAIMARYPKLDQKRVARAVQIVNKKYVMQATHDQQGNKIRQSDKLYIVRAESSFGYYYVDTTAKTCTCPDSSKGNVCKHRIAVHLVSKFLQNLYRHQYTNQ